jgi:hypothetical protein
MLSLVAAVQGWNDCNFPQVGYFSLDEGAGISYTYALAAMNGDMYNGGYMKGNFGLVGVTDGADVNPDPAATIYTDTTSNVQHLYIAKSDSTGSMKNGWLLRGSAIQIGAIGHGRQTNSIDSHSGMHAMLDKKHVAVKGGFRQLLTLPDATQWSSATNTAGVVRVNTKDQVPFVMKLDTTTVQGVGAGTTGWAKMMDEDHAGGASVYSVDGDAIGAMRITYKGCSGFNATMTSYDAYGRVVMGAMTGCVDYIANLAAADGSEVWKQTIPVALYSCRVTTDGSTYCGFTISARSGTVDFGGGPPLSSTSTKAAIVKFDPNGVVAWAKATHSMSFGDLAISNDGTLLAVIGSGANRGDPAVVCRIDTSAGTEGAVLWSDNGGVGTHGYRGVEVTDDGSEVIVFGQVTGTETLTDTSGATTTLRSRGSYEVFLAAYDASNGKGIYAMDGGGTGMEYFFAMASDPNTKDVYVGGTSRSEHIQWGDVKRKNVMYNGDPGKNNPDTSSAVGSSKAFVVQIKSTTALPSCLKACNPAFPLQASDVNDGHCYIDRHCYADGDAAPYAGFECTKCDAATNAIAWSAPDSSASCVINGQCVADGKHAQVRAGRSYVDDPCNKCDVAVSTSAYSAVAGCKLPTTFQSGYYTTSGELMMSSTEVVAMNQSVATLGLQLGSEQLEAQRLRNAIASGNTACTTTNDSVLTTLIVLVVVVGVLFLLVVVILLLIISKEKKGTPMFGPAIQGTLSAEGKI